MIWAALVILDLKNDVLSNSKRMEIGRQNNFSYDVKVDTKFSS